MHRPHKKDPAVDWAVYADWLREKHGRLTEEEALARQAAGQGAVVYFTGRLKPDGKFWKFRTYSRRSLADKYAVLHSCTGPDVAFEFRPKPEPVVVLSVAGQEVRP